MIKKVTHLNFTEEVLEGKGIVLVDFFASWCGPCRMLAPVLENLASELPELTIAKIDVDEEPALAAAYQVQSVPTLKVFRDGAITTSALGVQSLEQLKKMVEPQ